MNPDTQRKWEFLKPKDFRLQVLNLQSSIRPKLTSIMRELSNANNPNLLGKLKQTRYGTFYTINLNESYRLAYYTDFDSKKIVIVRVGSHKEVYGKD